MQNSSDVIKTFTFKTKTFVLKTKTKTLAHETKTKTCKMGLETSRDQDICLETSQHCHLVELESTSKSL